MALQRKTVVAKSALLRSYLVAVGWLLVVSAVGQIFLPQVVASGSAWGSAAGWQREIGFFDIAMAVVAFSAFRSGDLKFQRCVALALIVLTALVGTNHLIALVSAPFAWVHVVFTPLNYAVVAVGILALGSTREEAADSR
jgi:KinB signaling pathway activation protein